MDERARSLRAFPEAPPAGPAEMLGRLLLALALVALTFGVVRPFLLEASAGLGAEWLVLLRIGVFVLTAVVAGLLQGARSRVGVLCAGILAAGLGAFFLWPAAPSAGMLGGARWNTAPDEPGALRSLLGLEAGVLLAVLWGTLLARGLAKPAHLLAVVLCAAAGDAWLSVLHVPESVSAGHPVRLMRVAWPAAAAGAEAAPSFADLMFLALYLETARRFRFHGPSVVFGALAAYAVASFLSLSSWHVMLALPLVGLGVLMGAWPDFRCSAGDVLKAFALALLMFALLLGFTALRGRLHPKPKPRPDPAYLRNVARNGGAARRARRDEPATRRTSRFTLETVKSASKNPCSCFPSPPGRG